MKAKAVTGRSLEEAVKAMKTGQEPWRFSDLAPELQAALREGVAQADRGEGIDFDAMMDELGAADEAADATEARAARAAQR